MNTDKNFVVKFFCMALAICVLNGCVAVLTGGAGAGGYYVGKDERQVKAIAADAAITKKINALFVAEKDIKTLGVDVGT